MKIAEAKRFAKEQEAEGIAAVGRAEAEVDANYQRVCLLSKADSIENSINTVGETYYRKASFIDVVNQGLDLSLSTTISYSQIKDAINEQYRIRL